MGDNIGQIWANPDTGEIVTETDNGPRNGDEIVDDPAILDEPAPAISPDPDIVPPAVTPGEEG